MNTTTRTPHIGDVFYHGWGFNMSLNDFYEVVDSTPSGKTVTLRKLRTRIVSGDVNSPSGYDVSPILNGDDRFASSETLRKRVTHGRVHMGDWTGYGSAHACWNHGNCPASGTNVLLQCLFSRLISIFPQCGRMVFPGLVIMQSVM